MQKLFVYGTLKKGFPLHHAMGDSTFLGDRETAQCYALVSLGAYPALIGGDRCVEGELYEVDKETLLRLDWVEGYVEDRPDSSLYTREMIPLKDGELVLAYVWNQGEKPVAGKERGTQWTKEGLK